MIEGYRVPGFEKDGAIMQHVFRLPEWAGVGVSFQQEASGEHYVRRGELRPETHVQGEWLVRLDGSISYFGADIRRAMLDIAEHERRFRGMAPNVAVLGYAGAGNVTMNPFYLAWASGSLGYTDLDRPRLAAEHAYDGLVVHDDWRAEYRDDIRFGLGRELSSDVPVRLGVSDASSHVRFVLIGPTIVRAGRPTDEEELRRQVLRGEHYDLRHVLQVPHLRWNEDRMAGPPQVPADIVSFCPLLEAFWRDGAVDALAIERAFEGSPIDVTTEPYDDPNLPYASRIGRTIGSEAVVDALVARGYAFTDRRPKLPGEFRVVGPEAGEVHRTIEIVMRPGIYNHSALGVTEAGDLVWGCTTGLGGRVGITVCQMGRLMAQAGCRDAILLDQGGDVSLRLGDRDVVRSSYGRTRMRGVLFFVDPRREHGAGDLNPPAVTELAMRPISELTSWVG